MLSKTGRIALSSIMLAAMALGLGILSHRSFAGRKNIVPHKLTVLFTGDDWGHLKACG